jgi:ribosomal protein S18 acetylase RimI-like enzyme
MADDQRDITLRPATGEDREFLYEVYFSTRHGEVARIGWDEMQIAAFLRMQFDMRERAYKMQSPAAESGIIMLGAERAGSMITESTDQKIVLIDIAVLPQYQGNGIATILIKQLQGEAAASEKAVMLHVDKLNSNAFRLYERLGFLIITETELMYEMGWKNDR